MDVGSALPGVALFVVLLSINGFYVGAEYAMVRVRGTQLAELVEAGSRRARVALHISDHLDRYISAVQVGVTGASLALGIVGEPAIRVLIEPLFTPLIAVSETAFRVVSFTISFAFVTFLTLVLGELAPKYVAIQRAVGLALFAAYPLHFTYKLLFPFVWLVNVSANRVVRTFGITPMVDLDAHSEEELKMLIAVSTRKGILQESERVLVGNALDFADTFVRQVMTPRTEIAAIADDTPFDQIRRAARAHPFTRYPVFHEDLDHIVGVVHLKDLVGHEAETGVATEVMRRVPMLPETMKLDQALAEFRRQRSQLAVVIDEFGGTAGVITLEDVLEELVGDVQDEFDADRPAFVEESAGVYAVDGLASLSELQERLKVELEDEPYDTVGGMVFGRLGRVAVVGDAVQVNGHRIEVTAVDGRRVARVRVDGRSRTA